MEINKQDKKMKNFKLLIIALLIVLTSNSRFLYSQWSTDPTVNNPICIAGSEQNHINITSDGDGGAIIVWEDNRGTSTDIFAQRIDREGNTKWSENGITVCNALFSQLEPDLVSDGDGGAIIVWKDFKYDYDIYAQRVDTDGNILWQNNGVAICSETGYQEDFKVASDGYGGAIIVWEDARVVGDFNIYAQRISSDGSLIWAVNGIAVCSVTGHQLKPDISINENGGAIIAWEDNRNVFTDIYAQSVNANGEFSWTVNGIAICTATDGQDSPKLTSDGSGGAVIVWRDHRRGFYDIYTQSVNSLGIIQWQANGLLLLLASSYPPARLSIVGDSNGGAIVCWDEDRTELNYDIFAQRVNHSGAMLWQNGGIYVCGAEMGQVYPKMIADDNGGAIITWYDYRNQLDTDIYAQRVSSNGEFYWIVDGIGVSVANIEQINPVIVDDGNSGAIIAWVDYRNLQSDIYSQQINHDGTIGNPTDVNENIINFNYKLSQNFPNPFNPSTTISFSIPNEEFVSLKVFNSLGEEVAELLNETKPTGNYSVSFDASSHSGNVRNLTSGVYFYKIKAGSFVEIKKMILMK